MLAVIKKELKTYLLSPIGYVFIGLFLLIFSIFFYITIFQYRSVNFENLFYNGATVLTFITPVLTMRMFAEERKTGTEQLILTSPRSVTSIVLGKFIAAAIIMLITEAFTFMYFIILKAFGEPSLLVALTTLLGFFLLSLAYISFGMFASSITENQVIAGIITIAFLIMSLFIPQLGEDFEMISIVDFYEKFPIGVISFSDVVGPISFAAMFTAFTIIVMQRRKLVK